jgi:hypothetical protein
MANTLKNPADLVNAALVRIGHKNLIGNLYDGSEASIRALAIYGQTRDDMMRDGNWGFVQRNVALTLLKQAPANMTYLVPWTSAFPPLPWQFEYAYPQDMLKLRAVKPTPIFIPNFDPTPYPSAIDNDNSLDPPQRVILCNVENAIAVYAGRVTDPLTWPVDFTEALIGKLGEVLAPSLSGLQPAQMQAAESREQQAEAGREQG